MHWKKLISIILTVSMILSFSTVASAGPHPVDPTSKVRVSGAEGYPGQSVEAAVYLTPIDLINRYDITISFDSESLELVQGDEITNDLGVGDLGDTFDADLSQPGTVNVQADLVEYAIFTEDTKAFTLHFNIKNTVQPGELALHVTKHDLYEGELPASTTVEAGKITVLNGAHTVTFDSQGGSLVEPKYANNGVLISEPSVPTRAGYTFAGWYTEPEGSHAWQFATDAVTSSLTLYAQWMRNAAQIAIGAKSGTPGSTVDVPVTVASSTYGISAYGLQIDYDPAALEISKITGEAGDYFDSNYDNNTGWLLAAWADSDGGDTPIASGEKLFTISFKIKSDAVTGDKPLSVQTGDLSRFSLVDSFLNEMEKTLTPGKVTVTEAPAVQYSVTFDSQGGSLVSGVTVDSGTTVSEPTAPTKAGYTFAGWYKDAAGAEAWNFATDSVTSNVTLYAKWTAIPALQYMVTFDSQGGSSVSSVTVNSGATISEPTAPTKAGYTFAGWHKDVAGSEAWSFATEPVTSNVTLYAKWTQIPAVQYTVTFDTQGGSLVNSMTVDSGAMISEPAAPTKAGYTFAGWYKDVAGMSAWRFGSESVTADVTLYAKWTRNTSNSSNTSSTSTNATPAAEKPSGLQVIVDGVVKEQIAVGVTTKENGQNVLTATVDQAKLAEQLQLAADKSTVVIPVTTGVEKVSVVLTGEAVKSMAAKEVILEVQTPYGNYKLPAQQIAIEAVSSQLGTQVGLSSIIVHVDIAKSGEATAVAAETAAAQGHYSIVVPPVQFSVTASYNGKTVSVERFSSFVEREISIPAGVDASKVTTAAVVNPDGSVRHVPTFVTTRAGKCYAVVNSLTNSDYALIWNPKTFADVEGHWSKQAVNDMASRMIVNGVDERRYDPDASVTRAEFAAIIVRALGLADNGSSAAFIDVKSGDWYAGAVAKAAAYGLIEGYKNETFGPDRTIARQEAFVILSRAMKLAGLDSAASDAEALLSPFTDKMDIASWAKPAVITAVKNGLVEGSPEGLAPRGNLTRAETAAIVERFLIRAKLIDHRIGM
ncbi:InlB B-repeat-containing protein [Paenibacillus guangzhouensis]|uniref:InlB B-repeat-containing protein n=1 Tax=Paenibacillus guangzhouensis TaxID=1473112 RepID=UPI00187B7B48|nr:InlB B-repeat-containing protein [Paenibacillus guangzhouensis]